MNCRIQLGNRAFQVELPDTGELSEATVNGAPIKIQLLGAAADGEIALIIGRRAYIGSVTGPLEAPLIWIAGRQFTATLTDERSDLLRRLPGSEQRRAAPAGEVRAPMPGLVVKLNVAEGDTVKRGQGVLIVEAMKMENEIRATADGSVKRILVAPGKPVEKGELLLTIG